jgi:DNA invertase Pin-like site-specific DNA recombinase
LANKRVITDAVAQRIKALAAEGKYSAQIAREMGLSKSTVWLYCRRAGVGLKKDTTCGNWKRPKVQKLVMSLAKTAFNKAGWEAHLKW